jgi:hypothetical protein
MVHHSISTRVPDSVWQAINRLVKRTGMSRADVIRALLARALAPPDSADRPLTLHEALDEIHRAVEHLNEQEKNPVGRKDQGRKGRKGML